MVSIISIYHEIVTNKRKSFPLFTWNQPDSKKTLIELTRYVLLDFLKMSRQDIIEQVDLAFLTKHRIGSAVRRCYNDATSTFLMECFPEWNFKPWEFKKTIVPNAYWNESTCTEATKWLVEEVLQWGLEKVQTDISNSYFLNNNLGGMIRTLKIGAIDAVVMAYPNHDWTYLKERKGYKITPKQADVIRKQYKDGINMYELAKIYKVSVAAIFHVVHNNAFKKAEAPHR